MANLIDITCVVALLLSVGGPQHERFSKYKQVDAYQVRPGILMMPSYSEDGKVCMVVLEKDHYVNGVADLDSTLPREEITQILDELVPPSERGPLRTNKEMARLSVYSGNAVTSVLDFENVSFDISRQSSSQGDIVAIIRWKGRSCQ